MVINISAQAGQGKTSMMFWVIRNFLKEGKKVALVSNELTLEDAVARLDGVRLKHHLNYNSFMFSNLSNCKPGTNMEQVLKVAMKDIDEYCPSPDVLAIDGTFYNQATLVKYLSRMYPDSIILCTSQENATWKDA